MKRTTIKFYELRCYWMRNSKTDQYGRLTAFLEAEHLPMTKRTGIEAQGYFRVTLGEHTPAGLHAVGVRFAGGYGREAPGARSR